jgi:hypothetical protein
MLANIPTHAYAFFLALVGLVGIIVLTVTNHTVPTDLSTFTFALGAGGLGLAIPTPATKAANPNFPVSS